ncbi:hypothetical protein OC25_18075 [Pedobacter kyungheensis]|uniref:Uncharacterized protein n=1 Tax=Pedobacter kyungheensis TaxID=1069985 RepID=A0A0C1DE25_9SPHI|nr:hypothetical protein [Pedobacter kyungheensis]KIA92190.1 hypothetical protein OC25_18075 [Pedobacter kyungheensis]
MKNIALSLVLFFMVMGNRTLASSEFHLLVKTDTTKTSTYKVLGKSKNIESVEIRKSKKSGQIVYITVGKKKLTSVNNNSTAYGVVGKSESVEAKSETGPIFDNIEVLNGGYDNIKVDKKSTTQNFYTLTNINFPLRLRLHAGTEYIDFELKEAGRWDVDINYKNN